MRRGTEAAEAYESDGGSDHVGCIKRRDGYLVAGDGEIHHVTDTLALHTQTDLRTLGATQPLHDVFLAHLHACNGRVVDRHDAVTGQDAHLLAGPLGDGLYDQQRVVQHVELDAYALEGTFQGFVHRFRVLGVAVGRMGVQFAEHPVDGVLHQLVAIHAIYVIVIGHHGGHDKLAHGSFQGIFVLRVVQELCLHTQGAAQHHEHEQGTYFLHGVS